MSHIVTVQIQIRDPVAISTACPYSGCPNRFSDEPTAEFHQSVQTEQQSRQQALTSTAIQPL